MANGGYDGPVTKVELYVSCTKLVNKDVFSKSDPFAVLYESKVVGSRQKGWIKLDKTEVIYDNLNPKVYTVETKLIMHYNLVLKYYSCNFRAT